MAQRSGGIWSPVTKAYFSMLDAAFTNSTTTPANVIAIPVANGVHYIGYCQLYYKAPSTGGLVVSWTDPASPFYLISSLSQTTSATTINNQAGFSGNAQGVAVVTAGTDMPATINFSFFNGASSGTLQLRAASTAAVTLTIEEGSACWVQEQ
jgi:hypothetical protein